MDKRCLYHRPDGIMEIFGFTPTTPPALVEGTLLTVYLEEERPRYYLYTLEKPADPLTPPTT